MIVLMTLDESSMQNLDHEIPTVSLPSLSYGDLKAMPAGHLKTGCTTDMAVHVDEPLILSLLRHGIHMALSGQASYALSIADLFTLRPLSLRSGIHVCM